MDESFSGLRTLLTEEKVINSLLEQVKDKYNKLQEEHVSLTLSQGVVLEKLRTLSESRRNELAAGSTTPSTSNTGIVERPEILVLEDDVFDSVLSEINRHSSQNCEEPQQLLVLNTDIEEYKGGINTKYLVTDQDFSLENLDKPNMMNQIILNSNQDVVFCDESESD